jgi:hypothetical protein
MINFFLLSVIKADRNNLWLRGSLRRALGGLPCLSPTRVGVGVGVGQVSTDENKY